MAKFESGAAQQNISTRFFMAFIIGFILVKTFYPLEAYFVPYYVEYKGLTIFEVSNKLLPIISYGALTFILLAAPACEIFSYWTVIQMGNIAMIIWPLLLRFGRTLLVLQIMEVITTCVIASSTVFQAYMFLLVTRDDFQMLTSINQGCESASSFLAAELGQLLVSIGVSYDILLYISWASSIIACVIGFFLPKDHLVKEETQPFLLNFFSRDKGFWRVVKDTWKDKNLQILSFWWATAVAGFSLSTNYSMALFEAVNSDTTYNGQVLAAATACTVLSALCSVYLAKFVEKAGGLVYLVGSAVYGALCLTMAFSTSLWMAYPLYIILAVIQKLLLCFVYAQCARLLQNERYILLFSFNTAMSYVIMACSQAIIEISGINIYQQYVAVGSYFIVISVIFSIILGVQSRETHTMRDVSSYDESADSNRADEPLIENSASVE